MKRESPLRLFGNHDGSTVIFVAVTMLLLLAFAALAVDVGHIYVVRGELQNAADAGALAGAQVLYDNPNDATDIPGAQVWDGADDFAETFVVQHSSENAPVLVEIAERGHWKFGAPGVFTPNNSTLAYDLWNKTTEQLNEDTNFINAVRVITRRKRINNELPADFFGRILGDERAEVKAVAVGYIGFAGTLAPAEAEQPIAICQESIRDYGTTTPTCGVGRMINSGQNAGHNTGGWTNFTQPCDTANKPTVNPLICSSGNPNPVTLGQGIGTTGGEVQTVYDSLRNCWRAQAADDNDDTWPDQPWTLNLPVVTCPDNNLGPCSKVVGAVTVDVVWITRNDKNQMKEVPKKMGDWPHVGDPLRDPVTGLCAGTGQVCWDSFVAHFNLKDVLNNTNAFYEDKTIYFLPHCGTNIPAGRSGGENFGVLARIPVLVK